MKIDKKKRLHRDNDNSQIQTLITLILSQNEIINKHLHAKIKGIEKRDNVKLTDAYKTRLARELVRQYAIMNIISNANIEEVENANTIKMAKA